MSLTRWHCTKCAKSFFADDPICPSCHGVTIHCAIAQIMYLFNISDDEARLAIAVQDGEYPDRYKQIHDRLGISKCQMFIGVIIAANRGDYADDGIPAWNGTIGDTIEQEECWNTNCGVTFTPDPKREGQHLCPACEEKEHDHYHRRNDAAYPVGAVGS